MIKQDVLAGVIALPTTLLVLSAVGGATAQVTQADKDAVKRAVTTTAVVLIAGSVITGNTSAVVATIVAVGSAVFATHKIWGIGVPS